jgi:hypothetical protein
MKEPQVEPELLAAFARIKPADRAAVVRVVETIAAQRIAESALPGIVRILLGTPEPRKPAGVVSLADWKRARGR